MGYAFSPFGEEAMPWKECSVMDERLQFVARRLAGEPMAELCREFGISRKTGYKIFDRYQECGVQGLTEPPPLSLCPSASLGHFRRKYQNNPR
jgi:Helix-turn-helix domain